MQIAKWIIALVAVFNYGSVVADALVPATAKQHLWNPRWPQHAKFHNAQTMMMGVLGGSLSLAILFGFKRSPCRSSSSAPQRRKATS